MPQARLEIPVAMRPQLKRDYECSLIPLDHLAARVGMSTKTLSARIRELGWRPRRVDLRGRRLPLKHPEDEAAVAAVETAAPDKEPPGNLPDDPADCAALALRIRRAIEQELAEIERLRMKLDPAETHKAEGIARTLAALARTLQEAMRLEDQARPQTSSADAGGDDELPRDFDELRRALSQRLDALVAEREAALSRGA
jgi:hypothetical protein